MKSAFITGGGGYIGGEVALTLARRGIAVAVCDINEEAVARTVKRIEDAGFIARGYVGDVTNSKNIEEVMRRAVSELGELYAMVHVAGGTARIAGSDAKYLPIVEQEDYVIERVLAVNLYGAIWASRAAARIMIEQGVGGKIINFSSVVAENGLATCTDYAAAKGGVISFCRSLAKEVGEYKINVNSVAPGIVMRPDDMGGDARAFGTNFLARKCLASDVANVVDFLASDKADFVTGQVYIVDGGRGLAMKGSD